MQYFKQRLCSAVNKILSIHRTELNKVHKKQNELEQELQIVRNLSQRDERDKGSGKIRTGPDPINLGPPWKPLDFARNLADFARFSHGNRHGPETLVRGP